MLALTQNYRSRPEVLDVVNYLFGGRLRRDVPAADRGRPLPGSGLRPAGRAARHGQGRVQGHRTHWRAGGGAAHRARGCRSSSSRVRPSRARSCCSSRRAPTRACTRRRCAPSGLPTFRATGRDYYRPAAGGRPARLPAAAAQPLRRRGARLRARLAVRRRLERRAGPPAPRRAEAAPVRRAGEGHPRGRLHARRAALPGVQAALRPARRAGLRRSRSSGSASRSSARTTTTSRCSRSGTAAAATRTCASSARLARSYEELRGPDVEGFVRFVEEQDAVGASELEAAAEEEGTDVDPAADDPLGEGARVQGGRRRRRRPRLRRAPAPDEILCLPDGRLRLPGRRPGDAASGARRPTTKRCAQPSARPRRPSGCASTTSR